MVQTRIYFANKDGKELKLKSENKLGEYTQYFSNLDHDLPKDKNFEGLKAVIYSQHHRFGGFDMYYRTEITMKRNEYNKGYM